jgi:hypothetical protein
MILYAPWAPLVVAVIGWQTILGILWMVLGANVADENLRLVARLFAFMVFLSALGWLMFAPFWYLDLRATLRQAEAG